MSTSEAFTSNPPHDSHQSGISRRRFLNGAAVLATAAIAGGCKTMGSSSRDVIIDIHQHVGYSGRPDEILLAHQDRMGVSITILLPAGRPMTTPSTHEGTSNGLQAKALGNEACYGLARKFPHKFRFAANEVPDAPDATREIEKYLKLGAVAIAEQKFGVECDSLEMQRLYSLAADYDVPILMHWQFGMYNYGFERFYKMLEKFPRTRFIGHAQTWWANIDKNHADQKVLYPKTKVTPGGITDRYLSNYPNMFGDLSAGSGLSALTRDEEHATAFLARHQDKLMYGSDCNDRVVVPGSPGCQGSQTISAVRRLAPSREIQHKIFAENARRVFKI